MFPNKTGIRIKNFSISKTKVLSGNQVCLYVRIDFKISIICGQINVRIITEKVARGFKFFWIVVLLLDGQTKKRSKKGQQGQHYNK